MKLSDLQRQEFGQKGYLLLKDVAQMLPHLQTMHDDLKALGSLFVESFVIENSAKQIAALEPSMRKAFYQGLRYLPSTTQLACSPLLLSISRQLQLQQPAVMHSYNLRMDMPNEPQFMFHWHQDITYLLGSKNSVTYWVPLTPVDAHHGSIELIDGSHLNGLAPFHYTGQGPIPLSKSMSPRDLHLNQEPKAPTVLIEAVPGDIVVFSQFLLHRSTPNCSNQVRWVSQLRHSDLAEAAFRQAGYPFGDYTNIFQNDYLQMGIENG